MAIESVKNEVPSTRAHEPVSPPAQATPPAPAQSPATPSQPSQRVSLFTTDTFDTAKKAAPVSLSGGYSYSMQTTGVGGGMATGAAAVGDAGDVPDTAYDGWYVGAPNPETGERGVYPPSTPIDQIPAVTPAGGVRNGETIIMVNGVGQDVDDHAGALQTTANVTGSRVIGVHNATQGRGTDLAQALGDKAGVSNNAATQALTQTVISELEAGRSVHLMGYSQGALITSGALRGVEDYYRGQGLDDDEIKARMSNIKVETFGGAAMTYPDGPKYVHYINEYDIVPNTAGLGVGGHPGDGAQYYVFANPQGLPWDPLGPHGYDVYMQYRVPFDQIYYGGGNR